MPSARTKAVVSSALAVLGFRTSGDGWSFSAADEPRITAQLGGTTLLLSAPDARLSIVVKRPLTEDFVPRLRKRLGSLKKRAAKAEKASKKASRAPLASTEALTEALNKRRQQRVSEGKDEFYCGPSVRNFDPVAYCEVGKHFTRESLMVSGSECGDCAGWPTRSKR